MLWYGGQFVPASGLADYSTTLPLDAVPPGSGYQAIVGWRPVVGSGLPLSWGTSPGSFTVTGVTANLTSLALSGIVFGYDFAPATYAYTGVTVPYAITSITVTPTGAGVITVEGTVVASGSASAAIALTAGTPKTITVVATEAGKSAKTYTIEVTRSNAAQQATPIFSPAGGAVVSGTLVTITSPGADRIYYTTDGNIPNASSPVYSAPVAVSPPRTLKAFAVKAGYADSAVGSADYTSIVTVVAPIGEDTHVQGSDIAVAWTSSAGGELGLWARSASGGWYAARLVPASAGSSYSSTLTLDVPTGSGYQAIVAWRPTAGSGEWMAWGTSPGSFTVTNPVITVGAPTGTTTYARGSLLTVSWTISPAAPAAGELGLWARSAGGDYYAEEFVPASGGSSYSTTLTLDVPTGSGYEAIVAWRPTAGSGRDWTSFGTSPGSFTVTDPVITVSAPTGTTTYAQGSLLTVAWTTSPAATAGGELGLWARSSGGSWYAARLVPASGSSSYSTNLTLDVPTGSGYQAIVAWRPTAGSGAWANWGTSPGSFTVTSYPPPPPPPPSIATKLTITTQPVGAASGALLATQPIVRIEDAAGNLVSSTATITVYCSQGSGTLGGTTQLAAVGGVATFTNLTLAGTIQTPYTLTFFSGSLTTATSGAITVTTGALDHFDFVLASPQTSGVAFTGTNTLTAKDSGGNTLTGFAASGDVVTITTTAGTISGLSGGAVLNAAGDFTSGVANLTSLGMIFTGPAADYVFTATSATSKTGASGSVTINALAIGDAYQGGKIAYLDGTGLHGLIAAAEDQSTEIIWALDAYRSISVPGTVTVIGGGAANTVLIVAQNGAGSDFAAGLCSNLVVGIYSDWYLPSKDELNELYLNRVAIDGFSATGFYWSSSENEYYSLNAWPQYFDDGYQYGLNKASSGRVRAVRAF